MPFKSETIKIHHTKHDRRIKLTDEDKEKIKTMGLSQRALAKMFGVSRRTIQFILHPEKLEQNKKQRKERGGWKQYYNKEKQTEYVRGHREYKQKLYLKGEIKL
jgi:transposase